MKQDIENIDYITYMFLYAKGLALTLYAFLTWSIIFYFFLNGTWSHKQVTILIPTLWGESEEGNN